jgi:hypothetical protein
VDIKAELFEGGFEVLDDFLGEDVRIGKVIAFFGALSLSQKISRLALSRPINQPVPISIPI